MNNKIALLLIGLGCATTQTTRQQISSPPEKIEEKSENDYHQEAIKNLEDHGATINDAVQCIHRCGGSEYVKDLRILESKSEQASLDLYLQEKGEKPILYQRINSERKILTGKGNLYVYGLFVTFYGHSKDWQYICAQTSFPNGIALIDSGLDVAKTRQKMEEEANEIGKKMEEEFQNLDEKMNHLLEEQ